MHTPEAESRSTLVRTCEQVGDCEPMCECPLYPLQPALALHSNGAYPAFFKIAGGPRGRTSSGSQKAPLAVRPSIFSLDARSPAISPVPDGCILGRFGRPLRSQHRSYGVLKKTKMRSVLRQ